LRGGKESGQLSTPIVRIAIAGIAIGVCVMILALSIVTGFQQEIRAKVIGFGADIQISKYDSNHSFEASPINRKQDFLPLLKKDPDIKNIQVFATKAGIIKAGDAIEGVLFKGVDDGYDWSFFSNHLVVGRLPSVGNKRKSNELLISSALAKQLNKSVDSSLVMYFVQNPPKARKFKICGIYDTGLGENDFDKIYVLGDLRVVQQLNNWDSLQISGFEILLHDYGKLGVLDKRVYEQIPNDLNSSSIRTRYPQIFGWLDLMDTNVIIIITLMIVVSLINMVTSLLIMILERTAMIGLLKSLGAANALISTIFLKQAAYMIGIGLLLGNALGIGLGLLQLQTGFVKLNQETYYLNQVPVNLDFADIGLLNAGVFLICLLVMILPTFLVSTIRPARVMRFD
jgi:lipoprotein-releasing system permease protein